MLSQSNSETGRGEARQQGRGRTGPSAGGVYVLIVEDEHDVASLVSEALSEEGYQVDHVTSIGEAKAKLGLVTPDLMLLDLSLPDGSGMELLELVHKQNSDTTVLMLTGDSSVQSAVEAVRHGAYDYISKPFDLDSLVNRIQNAAGHRKAERVRQLEQRTRTLGTTQSAVTLPSRERSDWGERVKRLAAYDSLPILVTGETGAGKEAVSRSIHDLSPRADEPFIAINCANLERTLLQSELFGHEKGAFTGATERRNGLFELASSGTLFLDEVGEMPLEVQAAFLRVLETKRFRRLGGSAELSTNARIVAATNKNLSDLVAQGKFREDLMFRLNAVELRVSPLRENPEDIRALAEHFCRQVSHSLGFKAVLGSSAIEALLGYSWPGNIREIKNVIERSVLLHGAGEIDAVALQLANSGGAVAKQGGSGDKAAFSMNSDGEPLPLAEVEMNHIRKVLTYCNGNKTKAAEILGVSRNTLIRKLS